MWADDPWIREHSDAARQLARQSLAHRLDDIFTRAQHLAQDATGSWWESLAAYRAHAETERILARLSTLRENVWRAVG
jgi:hypothetical protein